MRGDFTCHPLSPEARRPEARLIESTLAYLRAATVNAKPLELVTFANVMRVPASRVLAIFRGLEVQGLAEFTEGGWRATS